MRLDIVMPQMGESIAEGTITRWIKQVGDSVERDEPLFEISTDKVDAEIPAPQAGTLVEIKSEEGATVLVNEVVAILETEGGAAVPEAPAAKPDSPAPEPAAAPAEPAVAAVAPSSAPSASGAGDGRFVSPVVRKIAAEHDIDPSQITGSGAGGRVTKKDILAFIEQGGTAAAAPAATMPAPLPPASSAPPRAAQRVGPEPPRFAAGEKTVREPMTRMRKIIAEHMVASRRTSAHVQSVFEVDMTHVNRLRRQYKPIYQERHGVNLTFLPFVIKSVCDGLRSWPIVNASVEGDEIVYKKNLNIGIAVALDWGLIVPVLRNADELSIAGLAIRAADLGHRSRTKELAPDEVQGGTFTITNPGQFGGLYGLPIINQPQVAIIGMGGIKKRPVVIDDAIAIRSMMYLSMSYDHRVVDGAVADQFLALVQKGLESFDESLL